MSGPRPYTGGASVAALIGLAKKSKHVSYRPREGYWYGSGKATTVTVSSGGSFRQADYDKPYDPSVSVRHKVTEVQFGGAQNPERIAGFEAEVRAAGWDVVKRTDTIWLVAGPGWKEWMCAARDQALASRDLENNRRVRASIEKELIRDLLAEHGVTGKLIEGDHRGEARVTLYLADIQKLTGEVAS